MDALTHTWRRLGALLCEPVVEEAEGDPDAGGDGRLLGVGGLGHETGEHVTDTCVVTTRSSVDSLS